ncbi:MAG: hypothetical protein AAFU85_27940 [Planctomycetota bacterium]
MPLPKITHLQFAVLSALLERDMYGKELRAHLKKKGCPKSLASFYQLMARLEDSSFVRGEYEEVVIDGQMIRQRKYTLIGEGRRVVQEAVLFYQKGGASYGFA